MLCVQCGVRYDLKEIGAAIVRSQPATEDVPGKVLGVSSGDLWECPSCYHKVIRDQGKEYASGREAQIIAKKLASHNVTVIKQVTPW